MLTCICDGIGTQRKRIAMNIKSVHHIAIICSNYEVSKQFYTEFLKLNSIAETYREERQSYKLDLAIGNTYCIELFSFPNTPERVSRPEARGLRHLAFAVDNIEQTHAYCIEHGVTPETIRVDELTKKSFFFIEDPDKLPIEFYEI